MNSAFHTADLAGRAEVYLSSARHHVALDPESYQVPDLDAVIARYRMSEAAVFDADHRGRLVGSVEVRLLPEPEIASMVKVIPTATVNVAVVDESNWTPL